VGPTGAQRRGTNRGFITGGRGLQVPIPGTKTVFLSPGETATVRGLARAAAPRDVETIPISKVKKIAPRFIVASSVLDHSAFILAVFDVGPALGPEVVVDGLGVTEGVDTVTG